MEVGRDFRSIINSVPFTFLVGPSHTKLTVQSGLARHVSRPLDHLMNSGQTRESKHQIAVLEDEDVETFVAFCEYAYTGDYGVPPPGFREDDREQDVLDNPFKGMFSGNSDDSFPASALVQSPGRQGAAPNNVQRGFPNGSDQGYGGGYAERVGGPRQGPPADGQQAWYLSTTTTEYPPQDPTATPRESDQSPTPSSGTTSSRGRRRQRDKVKRTDSKEQVLVENDTSKLTPPSTPPPDKVKIETGDSSGTEAAGEQFAEPDEEAPNPELDQSSPQEDSWEQSESVSTRGVDEYQGPGEDNNRGRGNPTPSQARPIIDTSFASQEYSSRRGKGTSLWDEFTAFDGTEFHPYYRERPPNSLPGFGLPYLSFHAKLYVFATRYLIPDLAHLCLRKLHRDLVNLAFPDFDPDNQYAEHFVLTTTKARMVLDLLYYTYTKTTRLEPITPTSATQLRDNELRRLVVHYAACKVRDLAEYCPPMEAIAGSSPYPEKPSARGLRALLDTLPELASDLIYRMI